MDRLHSDGVPETRGDFAYEVRFIGRMTLYSLKLFRCTPTPTREHLETYDTQ